MALHGRRARWACILRGGHCEAADLEVGYHHGGVSKKKKCIFLAYEIENDYLCKVNVMDIHKSIMQIQGDIPRQPMRYASNDKSGTTIGRECTRQPGRGIQRTILPGRQSDANVSDSPGEVYSEQYFQDDR